MDFTQWLKDPRSISVAALLMIAVVAFWREWVVSGTAYLRVLKERDEFKERALRGVELSHRALNVASKQAA